MRSVAWLINCKQWLHYMPFHLVCAFLSGCPGIQLGWSLFSLIVLVGVPSSSISLFNLIVIFIVMLVPHGGFWCSSAGGDAILAQCFSGSVACLDSKVMWSFPLTEDCSIFAKAQAGWGSEIWEPFFVSLLPCDPHFCYSCADWIFLQCIYLFCGL